MAIPTTIHCSIAVYNSKSPFTTGVAVVICTLEGIEDTKKYRTRLGAAPTEALERCQQGADFWDAVTTKVFT